MKRVAITLAVLGLLTVGAAYACNPVGVANYGRVGYSNVGYTQSYSVAVVSPYTPTVSLPATYAAPVAPACACEAPQTAAPPAYEAPVAAPAVRYAAPTVSYAAVAAPAISYATVGVPVVSYGYAHVGVGHHHVGVGAAYTGVVAAVRARPSVTVVRAKGGRVGLRERFQVKRAAVRAARSAR